MVHDDIEIAFSNPEAGVNCLGRSTEDLARPARYVADEVIFFWMNDLRVSVPIPLKNAPTCESLKSFSAKSFTTAEIAS